MPLLSYFSVVGTVLLGLLFVADAVLPDRPPLKFSTDFYGLPAHSPSQRIIRIHNPPPAPPPDMTSPAVMLANADVPTAAPPPSPAVEAAIALASAAEPPVHRVAERAATHRKQRQRVGANRLARTASERQLAQELKRRREGWQGEAWNRSYWQRDAWARAPQPRDSWSPWETIR